MKNKAVFLDRDGVINKEVNFLYKWEQFEFLPRTDEAIRRLNKSGYLVIVITNQPVVARDMCSEDELKDIHAKMKKELEKKNAKIDAVYYCPHHPDKGFPEENKAYKIECECRKPKLGLFLQAKKDFNIDFVKSYMIGDTTKDIFAGKSIGCKTILVKTGYAGTDKRYNISPDFIVEDLYDAAELILSRQYI
jgi:D,D-heptose 1,7-bisphosphate phosphatase